MATLATALTAVNCPAIQVPNDMPLLADAYSGNGANVPASQIIGPVSVHANNITNPLNQNALRLDLLARYPTLTEKALHPEDLDRAQAFAVGSALRGLRRAVWLKDANGVVLHA